MTDIFIETMKEMEHLENLNDSWRNRLNTLLRLKARAEMRRTIPDMSSDPLFRALNSPETRTVLLRLSDELTDGIKSKHAGKIAKHVIWMKGQQT